MGYVPWNIEPADWHQFLDNRRKLADYLAALQREILAYRAYVLQRSTTHHGINWFPTMFSLGYTLSEAVANTQNHREPLQVRRSLKEAWPLWEKDAALRHLSLYQRQQLERRMPTFDNPTYKSCRMAEIVLEFLKKPVLGDALLCRLFPELADLTVPPDLSVRWQDTIDEHQNTLALLKEVRQELQWLPDDDDVRMLNRKVKDHFAAI
jgi:hypothetical protein